MIGRRGLLGLLAALPFAGRAVASVPQDPTIWIRTDRMEFPIPWERERFDTFDEHVLNYSQGWGVDVEWGVTNSRDVKPTEWKMCAPHRRTLDGVTDPSPRQLADVDVGTMYINQSNHELFVRTEAGWQFVARLA